MLTKNTPKLLEIPLRFTTPAIMQHFWPSEWHLVVLVSLCAAMGSAWRVLLWRAELFSPFGAAATMAMLTFIGWYAWGFFTHAADRVLFGRHSDYRRTLNAFSRAYMFQALFLFTFTRPLGWLWGWVALFFTVAAWGIIGPHHLGMRTWQAIVAATLGMLLWLVCLLMVTLTLSWNGVYIGVGAFLA